MDQLQYRFIVSKAFKKYINGSILYSKVDNLHFFVLNLQF